MSGPELHDVVKSAVAEALAEERGSCRRCCDTCELEPNEHRDDHEFVKGCREGLGEARKAAIGWIVKGIISLFGLGLLALVAMKVGGGK